jgi:hypothetical protein
MIYEATMVKSKMLWWGCNSQLGFSKVTALFGNHHFRVNTRQLTFRKATAVFAIKARRVATLYLIFYYETHYFSIKSIDYRTIFLGRPSIRR